MQPSSVCFLKCRPLPTNHEELTNAIGPIVILSLIKSIDVDVVFGFFFYVFLSCSIHIEYFQLSQNISACRQLQVQERKRTNRSES